MLRSIVVVLVCCISIVSCATVPTQFPKTSKVVDDRFVDLTVLQVQKNIPMFNISNTQYVYPLNSNMEFAKLTLFGRLNDSKVGYDFSEIRLVDVNDTVYLPDVVRYIEGKNNIIWRSEGCLTRQERGNLIENRIENDKDYTFILGFAIPANVDIKSVIIDNDKIVFYKNKYKKPVYFDQYR